MPWIWAASPTSCPVSKLRGAPLLALQPPPSFGPSRHPGKFPVLRGTALPPRHRRLACPWRFVLTQCALLGCSSCAVAERCRYAGGPDLLYSEVVAHAQIQSANALQTRNRLGLRRAAGDARTELDSVCVCVSTVSKPPAAQPVPDMSLSAAAPIRDRTRQYQTQCESTPSKNGPMRAGCGKSPRKSRLSGESPDGPNRITQSSLTAPRE